MVTLQDLENWFTYHPPRPDQIPRYNNIREAAREFAEVILQNTSSCADQTATLRELRLVVMRANQTIACNE